MSKKRGNGEGSITKRNDGRWMARFTVHTAKGPKRRHVYGKTRKEAADKLARMLSDRVEGIVYDNENMTVGEYLDVWLKNSVRGSIRQSTYDRDVYLVENHVKPALGRIKLKNLSSAHVQGFYQDRLDAGLSASTVHKVHTILHKALARAVAWQMVPRNVTDAVEPPRPAPREMRPLSPAEARKLLDAAQGDRLEALYVLAVTTGMRQGELLGLGWEDVDHEAGTVRVRRTLTLARGGPRLTEPKTPKSRRSIRLTSGAVEALERHRLGQQAERAAAGEKWKDWGLVFATRVGTPIRRDNLHDKYWKPLLKRSGLPDTRFHDLRHTCATLLFTRGVHPKIVSEMLGHSSVSITLDIYSHVIPGLGDAAALAMEDALGD